jgi:hypothetical protein
MPQQSRLVDVAAGTWHGCLVHEDRTRAFPVPDRCAPARFAQRHFFILTPCLVQLKETSTLNSKLQQGGRDTQQHLFLFFFPRPP